MNKEEIIQIIKNANYLNTEQKHEWIQKISNMTGRQLTEVEKILTSAEEQKVALEIEQNNILATIANAFAGMNDFASKISKEIVYKSAEKDQNSTDEKQIQKYLNEVEND